MKVLPAYEVALEQVLKQIVCSSSMEYVAIDSSSSRILAKDVVADRDFPPFNRSQMDGYAVRASEIRQGVELQVVGQVPAGNSFGKNNKPNTCVAIATGAPVPDWCDAVVPHEKTNNGTNSVVFHCDAPSIHACMHMRGVDAAKDDVVVKKHSKLTPSTIGICASVGLERVPVVSKPKVIVITSGDEIVPVGGTPSMCQIRNSNNLMVAHAFQSMGCEIISTIHVKDCLAATKTVINESLDGRADLVVTVGGISAGKRDFFPEAFAFAGVENILAGANIQPGKPIIVGKHAGGITIGLPGNPVSALACCCLFGWPIVQQMQGLASNLLWQKAPLLCEVKPNSKRQAFRPCVLENGKVFIPTWQGSGDLIHTACTHGLVQLPQSEGVLPAGTSVSCLAFPWN